ncbi:hypothetical protein L7F22_051189 [Adiantum nelumboides]|nr:hypothetical protein [Adiantum nelumboides]
MDVGNTREEREDHSQDDASSGRSRSPSRRTRRPLEREDNSLRNRVQESGSKRRRSPSREVSSSPSPRGRKRERERHARRRHKSKRTPSPSSSPSKRNSFSSSSSSDGYLSSGHHKRRRHDTYRAWKRSRKLQKFKEGGKSITFQTYDGSYGATDKVLSFIQQFDAAFGGEDDHKIELIPGSSPPNRPPYRVSYAQQEEILTQVNELLEKGLVRPSSSPFCSSVLLVQKKDGSYRMCIDYRALNKQTIKNRFPMPRIEDIFDRLQGSTYYSRIDLKSDYHQIRIVPEDIHKTAFRTQFGLYEYVVMPFGLTNAPATFNRLMEKIFRKHSAYTRVFFDDIIVHSQTLEEHKKHLQSVFDALQANKEGIRMDPEKLRVIDEWPESCPLHDLTKKKAKYVWTPKENTAFMQLKAKLMTQPLLVLPDLKKPFEVHCDACGDSIGAVLSQEGHPIAYESRRLNSQERGLGVMEFA